jgi:hypothetical protein
VIVFETESLTHMNQQLIESHSSTEEPYFKLDGITHINVHTKAGTELGKMLAYYFESPFTHPYFGRFKCIEGFRCYIRGGCKDDVFRTLNGYRANKRATTGVENGTYKKFNVPHLKDVLLHANFFKIDQNKDVKEELITFKPNLPFDHYFLHGPGKVLIHPQDAEWTIDIFTELRKVFSGQKELEPFKYDYSELRKYGK